MESSTTKESNQIRLELDEPSQSSDPRLPFFGRRRSANTWVVSVFVVANLVAFVATMIVNDCPGDSGGGDNDVGKFRCLLRPLVRFSFQPLYENPLLGPSSSTLVKMGAMQRLMTMQLNRKWHLVTFPWLHAGLIHLIVNLSSIILVGIHLEQEFGPSRVAIIYLLSALIGGVTSTFFVQHVPVVGSSGALFGLLGATLAGMSRDWEKYAAKFFALALLGFIAIINFSIGLVPRVDNFANVGSFFSGVVLGFVLLFDPQLAVLEKKKGLFDYDLRDSVKLKQKLDKPTSRIIALVLFGIIFAGGLVSVFRGVNISKHCTWCQYINCVPTKMWSCNEKASYCVATTSDGRLILTCSVGYKFQTYPFANVSQGRIDDLCSMVCS